MSAIEQPKNRTVSFLAGQIIEALTVLERDDWLTARLILADLWHELEDALEVSGEPGSLSACLSPSERRQLEEQVARLTRALKNRPQSESREMAQQLEQMLRA